MPLPIKAICVLYYFQINFAREIRESTRKLFSLKIFRVFRVFRGQNS